MIISGQLLPSKKKGYDDIIKLLDQQLDIMLLFRQVSLLFLLSVSESISSVTFIKHLSLTTCLLHFFAIETDPQWNTMICPRPRSEQRVEWRLGPRISQAKPTTFPPPQANTPFPSRQYNCHVSVCENDCESFDHITATFFSVMLNSVANMQIAMPTKGGASYLL